MNRSISFLIAAHNEAKIINHTLNNLANLPYENYEVLVGLDGCTDETEEIVKKYVEKSKKFKYFKLNLRTGKPAVINEIIKKAKGEIIIINDADWIFTVRDKKSLEKFLEVFDDPKIGGIAESFPVEWEPGKNNLNNLGMKITSHGTKLWMDYQLKEFTYRQKGKLYIKEPTMFLTNVFRKKLYKPNDSLGDDFERTLNIINLGYNELVFTDPYMPRMKSQYNSLEIRDIFKQKIRTARARKQINEKLTNKIGLKYYIKSVSYILKNGFNKGIDIGLYAFIWFIITSLATLKSFGKDFDTKEGWTLRAKR